jgi:hypothetical protein
MDSTLSATGPSSGPVPEDELTDEDRRSAEEHRDTAIP